jgi:[amino group carrier protein]-lysine/ornithine hydrolase
MSLENVPRTLVGLLGHYSPSGQEAQAVTYLVGRMQASGYQQAFSDPAGNAVGVLGDGPQQIVLLGHIDTVPGEIPVREEGDLLYGRGAVDAKGPLAAFCDAAARVGPRPGWQIIVIGAVDEERESLGARFIVDRYAPAYTIIGEPSHWDRVTLGYKGSARAELIVRQALAHTAGPQPSAPETAFDIWQAIMTYTAQSNQDQGRVFDQILPSLRGFSSGEDGFQSWARLDIGARLPLAVDPPAWYATLAELAGEAQVQPEGFPISAYLAEKNTPLVRALLKAIRRQQGRPGFVLKTGTADLNIVAPAWDCPALAYGPGDSSLDHTPREHISIQEYERSVEVLATVLLQLTQA